VYYSEEDILDREAFSFLLSLGSLSGELERVLRKYLNILVIFQLNTLVAETDHLYKTSRDSLADYPLGSYILQIENLDQDVLPSIHSGK